MKYSSLLALVFFGLLATSQAQGTYRILTEEDPPFNFTQNGEVTGYSAEAVTEIIKRSGGTGKIQVMEWDKAYQLAKQGPNTILFSMMRTDDRMGEFHWVGPIVIAELVALVKSSSDLKTVTLDEAKKLKVGTINGWYSEHSLKKLGFKNLQLYPTSKDAVQALMTGQIDILAMTEASAMAEINAEGLGRESVRKVATLEQLPLYIAISKDVPQKVINKWQDTLDEMARDGTSRKINQKWLGEVFLSAPKN